MDFFVFQVSVDFFVFKLVWVFLVGYSMDSMMSGMVRGTVRYGIHDVWCGTVCDKVVCRWNGMMARCGGNIIRGMALPGM